MSAPLKDGGPAFPRIDVEHVPAGYGHGEHCETESKAGMSLRDYFAGQALSGLTVNYPQGDPKGWAVSLSEASYAYADAMIAAREAK